MRTLGPCNQVEEALPASAKPLLGLAHRSGESLHVHGRRGPVLPSHEAAQHEGDRERERAPALTPTGESWTARVGHRGVGKRRHVAKGADENIAPRYRKTKPPPMEMVQQQSPWIPRCRSHRVRRSEVIAAIRLHRILASPWLGHLAETRESASKARSL
eukprot:scaffold42575_cov31-Tisochrysis_lutea.AAC.3